MMSASQRRDVLVYLECNLSGISPQSLEAARIAAKLAAEGDCVAVGVLACEGSVQCMEQAQALPLDRVYAYISPAFSPHCHDVVASVVIDCVRHIEPAVLLLSSSPGGKTVASCAAVAFETGLAADCTSLRLTPDMKLHQKRPAFGGAVNAWIETLARPQIVTVRLGMIPGIDGEAVIPAEIILRPCPELPESRIKLLNFEQLERKSGIVDAEVLVVAGGGVKTAHEIDMLSELAARLGGALACSRAPVQRGILPSEIQIGLSGKAVKPKLMLCFGVSGSEQFLAGVAGARYIIAVNSDPRAGILKVANLPILGDLREILPALLDRP